MPDEIATIGGRRVPRPRSHGDARRVITQALRGEADAGERGAQVALDVVGQGLEGADIENADRARVMALPRRVAALFPRLTARGRRAGPLSETVQAPQEGSQRLATPRWRVDQRVAPLGDRRPALRLGGGGCVERRLEPGPDRRPERCQGIRGPARGGRAVGWCPGAAGRPLRTVAVSSRWAGSSTRGHGTPSIGRSARFVQMF